MTAAIGHRSSRACLAVLLGACLLALGSSAWPAAASTSTSRAVRRAEARIRACANRERHKHGLPSVHASRVLHRAARLHARNMARFGFFDHVDPWRRSPGDRIRLFSSRRWSWGENISAGYSTVRSACSAWMHSPGHRANILERRFEWVGGGFARTPRGPYHTYFVMELGTPLRR